MAMIRRADISELTREALVLDLGDLKAQGETLKTRATREAEDVLTAARAEHRKLVEAGYQEGFAKGLAEGLAAGQAKGLAAGREAALAERREQLTKVESALAKVTGEFEAEREEILLAAKQDVLRLALAMAERVVKRALRADPGLVVDQVVAALAQLSRPTRVVIAVNPDDLELVQLAMPKLAMKLGAAAQAELIADGGLERGSCHLRTGGGGEIDASIRTQLDRINEALLPLGPGGADGSAGGSVGGGAGTGEAAGPVKDAGGEARKAA